MFEMKAPVLVKQLVSKTDIGKIRAFNILPSSLVVNTQSDHLLSYPAVQALRKEVVFVKILSVS